MRGLTLLVALSALAAVPAGFSETREVPEPTGTIAYAPRFLPTDNWEIFTIRPGGGGTRNLTRSPGCHESNPAWSHDGTRIAFACVVSIVVMRDDRSARRTILRLRRPPGEVAWSADDRQLAFAGYLGIRVVNTDGTGLRRLTRGRDASPSWSPDGRTITFSREIRGVSHVLRMRADGSGQRRLASRAGKPSVAPDGKTIAFLRGLGWIWLMDFDGSRQRRLSRAGDGHVDLAWSPDGRHLAYQRSHYEIYVSALDGRNRRLLRTYGADISGMDWGP